MRSSTVLSPFFHVCIPTAGAVSFPGFEGGASIPRQLERFS